VGFALVAVSVLQVIHDPEGPRSFQDCLRFYRAVPMAGELAFPQRSPAAPTGSRSSLPFLWPWRLSRCRQRTPGFSLVPGRKEHQLQAVLFSLAVLMCREKRVETLTQAIFPGSREKRAPTASRAIFPGRSHVPGEKSGGGAGCRQRKDRSFRRPG